MIPSVSILQISDLHRERLSPIRNDVLLNSLENDRTRYATGCDSAPIRSPDIIVVSGDIIRGVPPGTDDYESKLGQQHQEALQLLTALTDRLLGGDRKRLVLVPGNHDVSACHFIQSLEPSELAADGKNELVSELFYPGSRLRWSWQDFGLYKVANQDEYARRLAPFSAFYAEFYQGTRAFDLDPARQFDIFDYPEFNLAIVGFSSCHENDFFNKQGGIHPGCIAEAGLRLRNPQFNGRIRAAVWHHNTEGSPAQSDYMDASILQNLIDSGFSVGLHGHQHRPRCFDTRFNYGGNASLSVISAGTLCGSSSSQFGRAYNLIELDLETCEGHLHVREMLNDDLQQPIWGCRPLPPDTGAHLAFTFDPPPPPVVAPTAATSALLEAQRLYNESAYATAADVLIPLLETDDLARRLLLDCLGKLNDTARIVVHFDPPFSETEAIYLMEALWAEKNQERLRALVDEPIVDGSADPAVAEIRRKYQARLAR